MSGDFPFNHFLNNNQDDKAASYAPKLSLKELKLHDKKSNIARPEKMTPTVDPLKEQQAKKGFSLEELEIITTELLNIISVKVNPEKFNAFFKNTFEIHDISMDVVYFKVTTNLIKTMLERQFIHEITKSLSEILGKSYKVVIDIANIAPSIGHHSDKPHQQIKPKDPSEVRFTLNLQQTQEDLLSKVESQYIEHMDDTKNVSIDPSKSFSNFIVGPSNNLAFAAAIAVTKDPGRTYKSLYIHSNSGLGKTHLLHAVANGIRDNYPHYLIGLITAREFLKEMIVAIRAGKREEFQNKYSEKFDVLMIDDIHELSHKEGTQDELFHVFNSLYNKGKQLIFTSDKAPDKIEGIEERIRTRLQWGLVVDIQKPDLETRIALLKRKAYELDLYLQDDIVNMIAVSIKNNIRELEGAAIKLKAFSEIMQVEIDKEITKEVLSLGNSDEEKSISLDDIAKATASYYKVHLADLKSKARQKAIANARFVAMYLSRKVVANATQVEIGHYFSRDHSSVVHAEKEIVKRLTTDASLSKDITAIEANL